MSFQLPALRSAGDAAGAMASITAAVAAGEITPGEAAELSRLVEAYVKAIERASSTNGFGQSKKETVRRELKRRLRAAELSGSGGIEIWIFQGDGTVRGPHGEQMMREEAEALGHAAGTVPIFFSEVDLRL